MKLFGSHKTRSRSASMQLSINAIVILVLAMAILGLGLGIVKGISAKKDTLLDFDVPLDQTADATNPIANIDENWDMRQGKELQVGASFYNSLTSTCLSPGAEVNVSCDDATGTFTYLQKPQPVKTGEPGMVKARITANGFNPGSYACSFQIVCEEADVDVMIESETIFIDMI